MPVIVGSPWRRTRSFITDIRGVRFNPDWTVPAGIKRFDIWPKIKEDREYINEKGLVVYSSSGPDRVKLDAWNLDWNNMTPQELQKLKIVSVPGEHNPLGRVRVLMENKWNIYLHDTNHPEYFEKVTRTLSSGCIRMSQPEKMARFIMKNEKDWDYREMSALFDSGEKTDKYISDPIRVYILYYTNWIDDSGRIVYGTDVYKYDQRLLEQLAKIDGFTLPKDSGYKLASYSDDDDDFEAPASSHDLNP